MLSSEAPKPRYCAQRKLAMLDSMMLEGFFGITPLRVGDGSIAFVRQYLTGASV